MGLSAPAENYKNHIIMGKVFDPSKPQEYVDSFAIRKAV
jgi:nitrate/nitrite transport system substrate-binding protein